MIRIIHISDLHYQTNYNKLNCFYKEFMPQLLSPFVIIDELLKECDVLVDGPFIMAQRDTTLAFRGSKNQRLIDVQKSLSKGEIVLYEKV